MTACLLLAATMVTIGAAVRSTWSPCGLSMLASITPLSELGRGHRYRATAAWFVVGATLGGATLGAAVALLALGFHAMSLSPREISTIALGAGLLAWASDVGVGGFRLPVHHRQVNERWLDQFRPWVYGAGFGWQIGTGLATYIVTAAVYLMVVLAALIGNGWAAIGLGALFGLLRGLVGVPWTTHHERRRLAELPPVVQRARTEGSSGHDRGGGCGCRALRLDTGAVGGGRHLGRRAHLGRRRRSYAGPAADEDVGGCAARGRAAGGPAGWHPARLRE